MKIKFSTNIRRYRAKFFINLQRFFIRFGFFIGNVSSSDDIKSFLQLIRPVTSELKLIRVGGDNDGGYLIPDDDLENIETLISPGVGESIKFDLFFAKKNSKCILLDPTIKKLPTNHSFENIFFEKKFFSSEMSENSVNLQWLIDKYKIKSNHNILQLDIEGGEYDFLLNINPSDLRKFRIMVIEFHSLQILMYKNSFSFVKNIFKKILNDFYIIHIHPNNIYKPYFYKNYQIPSFLEITFIRKDRVSELYKTDSFPHPLDQPGSIHDKDYILPDCFWK